MSELINVIETLRLELLDSNAIKKADFKRERRAYRNLKNKANGGLIFPKPKFAEANLQRGVLNAGE